MCIRDRPRMMNMQQLNAARSALQVQMLREQVMHHAQVNTDAQRYRAATVGRDGPPVSGDGQWVETQPGRWQHISEARPPVARTAAAPRPEINAASILQGLRPHGSS